MFHHAKPTSENLFDNDFLSTQKENVSLEFVIIYKKRVNQNYLAIKAWYARSRRVTQRESLFNKEGKKYYTLFDFKGSTNILFEGYQVIANKFAVSITISFCQPKNQ